MARKPSEYYSIKIAQFLMKAVGFWYPETPAEKWLLNGILAYTLLALGGALFIEAFDFYYSWGDFYAITYTACSTMPVVIVLLKISMFILHRPKMLELIKYTQENFWQPRYDAFGEKIMEEIDNKGIFLMCSFTFFVQGTVIAYTLTPVVENIGKNESDRILPFTLWIDIPTAMTPYFEVCFTVETFIVVHTGACFCCFDNFFCLLNMHTAGQFKILRHKLERIFDEDARDPHKRSISIHEKIRDCVIRHNDLIDYVKMLEYIFTYTTLCQLMISGILLCVAGFQVFLSRGTLIRKMIFILHTTGCFFQLFVITMTANEILVASEAVGDGAYFTNWPDIPRKTFGKIKGALLMIIIRSRQPCYITAGGFFPVTLETFMAVLSTAASYFTLLRKFDDDLT